MFFDVFDDRATAHINWRRRQLMTWHAEHAQIVCRNSLKTASNKHSDQ
jgi:hypothetical protein